MPLSYPSSLCKGVEQSSPNNGKEALFRWGGAAFGLLASPGSSDAVPVKVPDYVTIRGSATKSLGMCPGQPVKKACWSTEDNAGRRLRPYVAPPKLVGPAAVLRDLEETISEYPQSGQGDIDGGGWTEAERSSSGGSNYVRYEFVSKRFKYVDDLEIRVDAGGNVSVRSASRNGGFDYNVNSDRLNYITLALQKKGWQVTKI
eukprot:CAMPEP_0194280628 /NCGR_PEP_ID=MMETSP0169-20130528/18060_1 /TAXON_ID=218684 /ORGANISM="Corethron pennatum, Strain L29A3" /LENGTH=201 /DNA_ID=CAMNT_0039025409 /DNA_START=1 /DNA_END=607 /DNA_ORIENTATION=-